MLALIYQHHGSYGSGHLLAMVKITSVSLKANHRTTFAIAAIAMWYKWPKGSEGHFGWILWVFRWSDRHTVHKKKPHKSERTYDEYWDDPWHSTNIYIYIYVYILCIYIYSQYKILRSSLVATCFDPISLIYEIPFMWKMNRSNTINISGFLQGIRYRKRMKKDEKGWNRDKHTIPELKGTSSGTPSFFKGFLGFNVPA